MADDSSAAVAFFEDPLYQFITIDAAPVSLILLFSLFLSLRLRKKAWDSPSKRFSRELEICFVLLYFVCLGIWKRGGADGTGFILLIVLFLCVNFLMIVSATALMIQILFPWLPEAWKLRLQSKSATRSKVVLEILVLAIIIFYNICWILLAALFIESSVGFDVLEVIIFVLFPELPNSSHCSHFECVLHFLFVVRFHGSA